MWTDLQPRQSLPSTLWKVVLKMASPQVNQRKLVQHQKDTLDNSFPLIAEHLSPTWQTCTTVDSILRTEYAQELCSIHYTHWYLQSYHSQEVVSQSTHMPDLSQMVLPAVRTWLGEGHFLRWGLCWTEEWWQNQNFVLKQGQIFPTMFKCNQHQSFILHVLGLPNSWWCGNALALLQQNMCSGVPECHGSCNTCPAIVQSDLYGWQCSYSLCSHGAEIEDRHGYSVSGLAPI
jgi:hypothetical protein